MPKDCQFWSFSNIQVRFLWKGLVFKYEFLWLFNTPETMRCKVRARNTFQQWDMCVVKARNIETRSNNEILSKGRKLKKHLQTMSHRERAKHTLTSQSFSSMTTSFLIKMAFSSCSLSNLTLSSSNSISSLTQTFWISQQSRAIIHSSQLDQNIFLWLFFDRWPGTGPSCVDCLRKAVQVTLRTGRKAIETKIVDFHANFQQNTFNPLYEIAKVRVYKNIRCQL